MVSNGLNLTLLALTLLLGSACERYKPSYLVPKKAGGGSGNGDPANPGGAPGSGTGSMTNSNTEITLVSSKLVGQEAKYGAIAKFGGVTSARLALAKADSGVKFEVPGLPIAKSGVLVVEIYEGDKLRFIAKKAKLKLATPTTKANTVKVDECLILPAPWDGLKSDGSCDWDIEEAN